MRLCAAAAILSVCVVLCTLALSSDRASQPPNPHRQPPTNIPPHTPRAPHCNQILFYPTAIGSEPQDPTINSYPHWTRTMLGHAAANMVGGRCGALLLLFLLPAPFVTASRVLPQHSYLHCAPPTHPPPQPPAPQTAPQVPVVASNRIGKEAFDSSSITFYGGSFIGGAQGEVLQQVGADAKALVHGNLDPNPDKSEGFVVQEFDLDALRETRRAWGMFRDRRPELYRPLITLDGGLVPPAMRQ